MIGCRKGGVFAIVKINRVIPRRAKARMPRFQRLTPGFSTADASYPSLQLTDNLLTVTFDNWQLRPVVVIFENAVAVRWEEGDSLLADHRDDECYVVEESPWLADHFREADARVAGGFQHYRLCFNAVGVLDVIATNISQL